MTQLFDTYRKVHTQGFLPVFTDTGLDPRLLIDGCVAAGMEVIEYTLRCKDARELIPWIRQQYPDLVVLVGSTIDDDRIVAKMKSRHPQLMTLTELSDLGVHGFVSQLRWAHATIERYAQTHIVMPSAATNNEAYEQVCAGAQLIKVLGPDLDVVNKCRAAPAHDYCPVFVTGGQTLDRIPQTIRAGAVCVGTGFDVTLKGASDSELTVEDVAKLMREYLATVRNARQEVYPELEKNRAADRVTWLRSLPHYHSF